MYDRPFRWWVQSVMPLVFDDSLSYYEVLAKLTKYIEGLTGDVDQIEKILATIEGIEDVTQFTEFLERIQAEIGNLENLQTDTKANLVSAINEVALKADIAYWKPPTGIPESDLSQEVKDKLNRVADATEYIINNRKLKPAPSNNSLSELGLGTYTVPTGGIPWDTLSQDVQDRINAGGSGGGGTGGTTDYNDLNNKPQINGHTLNAGNNTGESLGIGTYSKPSGGIPESDLSTEVQGKLNTSGGIADNQTSFVASRDYEAGELVYINGVLYKTKNNILTGTTMIPGNNIEETDISSELEKINDDIDALQSGAGPDSWNLEANLISNSTANYVNFFEYFNAIGGENYLFICTPTADNKSPYEINILKRDGTVVYTRSVTSSTNQERFTFTPVDTGEYYCRIRKMATSPDTPSDAKVNVKLEYTQSQGISELWSQVNKATQLEPRVSALETLTQDQQEELDDLSGVPARVNELSADVSELSSKIASGATVINNTANGAVATFDDGSDGMPMKKLEVEIRPVQSGSGTPSSENIRAISGWDECDIFVSPTLNSEDGRTVNVVFPDNAGTVYGGTLDVVNGTLTVKWFAFSYDTAEKIESFGTYTDGRLQIRTTAIPYPKIKGESYQMCSHAKFEANAGNIKAATASENVFQCYPSDNRIFFAIPGVDTIQGYRDFANEQLNNGTPLTFVSMVNQSKYVTYHLDPVEVNTLLGVNNVWSNAGNVAVEYCADTKLYLNKIFNAILDCFAHTVWTDASGQTYYDALANLIDS